MDTGWRKTLILEAHLDAGAAAQDDSFVMFSGHHDTWYYGVMDNGGANATMLEVSQDHDCLFHALIAMASKAPTS